MEKERNGSGGVSMSLEFEQKMRDAIAFYEENHFPLSEMIKKGRDQGLTEAQVRIGMVKVHDRIRNGEKLKPMRYAWQAWIEGKAAQGDAFRQIDKDRAELRKEIAKLSKQRAVSAYVGLVGWLAAGLLAVQMVWGVVWD